MKLRKTKKKSRLYLESLSRWRRWNVFLSQVVSPQNSWSYFSCFFEENLVWLKGKWKKKKLGFRLKEKRTQQNLYMCKTYSSNWWTPHFNWSSDPDYIDGILLLLKWKPLNLISLLVTSQRRMPNTTLTTNL